MLVFSFVRLFILTRLMFEKMMASIEYGGGKRTNLCHTEVNLSRGFRFNEKLFLHVFYVENICCCARARLLSFASFLSFVSCCEPFSVFLFENQRDKLGTRK